MTNLDEQELYSRNDPSCMGAQIRGLPAQCKRAWDKASSFQLPARFSDVDKVVILGMGGSAIGGDLVRALTAHLTRPMISINREYDLPGWVDSKTLVIASSYSGNTEETISAFTQALNSNCRKLVISTGGSVSAMATERDVPVFTIDHVSSPRAALGYSLMPLLAVMQLLGFVEGKAAEVESMVALLEKLSGRWKEDVPRTENKAKSLALKMHGKVAVIYGAGILTDVARRWKTQINENSKAWAFFETFPELNHNAIVGYHYPQQLSRDLFVVMLRSPGLHPRTQIRYKVTGELLEKNGIPFEYIDGEGDCPLSNLMSLVLLGDWISYYLAMLYGVDPTPVPEIDILKKRLAEFK
ncbi:MAG: bifunctional phosphoglucose/phosphomannose isomerase [Dehalococcoidia bacterium]|nr:bifunctional phosphoglucose/phosphomannose isomerase [Dehalococcoidia bacterium]